MLKTILNLTKISAESPSVAKFAAELEGTATVANAENSVEKQQPVRPRRWFIASGKSCM